MIQAFCPGHISCVFRPFRTSDPLSTGSTGIGIRLNLGSHARVSERDDGVVKIRMDGIVSDAPVTRVAVGNMAPGQGFDIEIEHDLPVGQGFGTSASGTLAACLCIAELMGYPDALAYMSAHIAEVSEGGGLGDLSAILPGYEVPVRSVPGLPPKGKVVDSGISLKKISLAVFQGGLDTASIINDPEISARIADAGDSAMNGFMSDMSEDSLFGMSNEFSKAIGLENSRISEAMELLKGEGYRAGMCMLGNSIFTDAPKEVLAECLKDVRIIEASSSAAGMSVTRTA